MANHAAQVISRAGVVPAYSAAANGDSCDTGDTVVLHVKNGSGSSINVTLAAQGGEGGLNLEDLVVAVPANTEKVIGPIVASLFGDPGTGNADIAYSALTTVTVACLSL